MMSHRLNPLHVVRNENELWYRWCQEYLLAFSDCVRANSVLVIKNRWMLPGTVQLHVLAGCSLVFPLYSRWDDRSSVLARK